MKETEKTPVADWIKNVLNTTHEKQRKKKQFSYAAICYFVLWMENGISYRSGVWQNNFPFVEIKCQKNVGIFQKKTNKKKYITSDKWIQPDVASFEFRMIEWMNGMESFRWNKITQKKNEMYSIIFTNTCCIGEGDCNECKTKKEQKKNKKIFELFFFSIQCKIKR